MPDLKAIPDETKWKLAAQCAALLPLLYGHVFRPVVGSAYDEHEQEIWLELANISSDIVRSLKLPARNAPEIAESIRTVNAILFGPDFKDEVIEVGDDGTVLVIRRCPFLLEGGGLGSPAEKMFHRCMVFTLALQNRINPGFESRFVRAMCMGDRQCEIKIGPAPADKQKPVEK